MSFSDFQEKYEIRLIFLHYLALLSSIPSRYISLLGQTFPKQIISKLEKILQRKQKVTKLVYDNMIKDTDAFLPKLTRNINPNWILGYQKKTSLTFFLQL